MLILVFAIGASFVQRTTGFGFGIFIMTILPYLLPSYGEATTLSGLLASVTSLMLTIRYFRLIPWRKLLPILITFMVVSCASVQLLSVMRSHTLHIILGVTLIAAAVYFWFFAHRIRIKPHWGTQLTLGSLSGVMGGLFGMQGPPAVLYFLQVTDNKEQYTALAQSYFLLGNMMMTCYRIQAGFLSEQVLIAWCWALPGVFIGTYLGNWAFKRLSMPRLRKIVYLYIALSGVLALLR